MRFSTQDKRNPLQFLPDSPEQIAESIDRTGLRDKLNEVFQAAIARAKENQQEPAQPAIDETRKGDLKDDAPLK